MFIRSVLFVTFWLLISTLTMASDALTDIQVQNYIKSGPQFKQWSIKNQATLKAAFLQTKQSAPANIDGIELMERSMVTSGLTDELDALVKPFGFDSGMQYLGLSQRIMTALMAFRMRESGGAEQVAEKRMQEALKRLEQSNMSAEQKAKMRQMINGSHNRMAAMIKAPEADIAVVGPHAARIQQAFGVK